MLQEFQLEDEPDRPQAEVRAIDRDDGSAPNMRRDALCGGGDGSRVDREAQWRVASAGAASSFVDRIDCSIPTSAGLTRW
jgi:hypothetical protein